MSSMVVVRELLWSVRDFCLHSDLLQAAFEQRRKRGHNDVSGQYPRTRTAASKLSLLLLSQWS